MKNQVDSIDNPLVLVVKIDIHFFYVSSLNFGLRLASQIFRFGSQKKKN